MLPDEIMSNLETTLKVPYTFVVSEFINDDSNRRSTHCPPHEATRTKIANKAILAVLTAHTAPFFLSAVHDAVASHPLTMVTMVLPTDCGVNPSPQDGWVPLRTLPPGHTFWTRRRGEV
jgi:hypothetical protein